MPFIWCPGESKIIGTENVIEVARGCGWDCRGTGWIFWGRELLYILIVVVVTWLYTSFRISGLLWRLSGTESACQYRRPKRCGFNPWVGKIPWRTEWQPTPVFLLGEFHRQRSLAGYSPWGRKESDTMEQLNTLTHFSAQNSPICWGILLASLCHYNVADVTTPFSVSPLCLVGLVTLSCDSLISLSQSLLGSVSTLRASAVSYDFLYPQPSVSNLAWFSYSTTISYTYK